MVSYSVMGIRWRLVLPAVGLSIFGMVTYDSARMNFSVGAPPSRYFYWSSIRLDSDPLNRYRPGSRSCEDDELNCGEWDGVVMWVDPSWLTKFLMLSALPAFALGALIVSLLGRLGISQVRSFMVCMPLLIFIWYYSIGWLSDRWLSGRRLFQPSGAPPLR